MYEDLQEQAVENLKNKKAKKRGVHTVGVIFTAVSILLFIISSNFSDWAAYWIKFPIIVLALVYAIIHFSVLGFPFLSDDDELTDEEIEREIVKIYKQRGMNKANPDDEKDELELREIEALKNKWDDEEEEFV